MSLRFKFLAVVGALWLAVVGSISAALWAFTVLHRELAAPLGSMSEVLRDIAAVKRDFEATASILYSNAPVDAPSASPDPQGVRGSRAELTPRSPTTDELAGFDGLRRHAEDALAHIAGSDRLSSRTGKHTARTLEAECLGAFALADRWFRGGDEVSRAAAGEKMFALHELIERTEQRILADAIRAESYGDALRTRLIGLLASVFAAAGLTGALAVILLRRWVERPVAGLRHAAMRIAAGDLAHRIDVRGHDEIALLAAEVNHMTEMVSRLQEERIRRERLAALGEMARRLAHNIRNPLSGIRGLAEVARLDAPPGSEQRDSHDLIIETVDRVNQWLSNLLTSTAPMELHPVEVEVLPWLDGVVAMHRAQAQAAGVRVAVDSQSAPLVATFDPYHLEQVLVAVVTNAIQASPGGGKVTVRVRVDPGGGNPITSQTDLGDNHAGTPAVPAEGGGWLIEVQDEGPGVPKEHASRIFDPHFSTKRGGTGTGLAMAKQVVLAHGGTILLASDGPGARLAIRLPLRVALPAARPE